MKRFTNHIAIATSIFFAVSIIGLPVMINYCTMMGKYRADDSCCLCSHQSNAAGAHVESPACLQHTQIGAPITTAFVATQHQSIHVMSVASIVSVPHPFQNIIVRMTFNTHISPAQSPPLLRSSILRI